MLVAEPADPLWVQAREERWPAEDLLKRVGVRRPPVRIYWVAKQLGVQTFQRPVIDLRKPKTSGMLKVDWRTLKASIFVRSGDSDKRKRFTVAHELGHLVLHAEPGTTHYRDTTFVGSYKETQANRYAADLLMPLWMLHPLVMKWGPDVERLARLFVVSNRAMEIRLMKWAGY